MPTQLERVAEQFRPPAAQRESVRVGQREIPGVVEEVPG